MRPALASVSVLTVLPLTAFQVAGVDSLHRRPVALEARQLRELLHQRVLAAGETRTGLGTGTGTVTFGTTAGSLTLAGSNTAADAAAGLTAGNV
jgi:hypothetical protein